MSAQNQLRIQKGDVLFRPGDPSDRVLRVASGKVEVTRGIGAASVLLGYVQEGEWLGEMGAIENRPRSATARAAADGAVESMTAQQFLARVSGDPGLAHDLLLRLSIRLKRIEDKIAGDLLPFAHAGLFDAPDTAAAEGAVAENATISLAAQTDTLRAQIGAAPIRITEFPFIVGRVPEAGEPEPPHHPNLLLRDHEPFRLSRDHFMVTRSGDRLLISDLGSTLGTIVNGRAIGHHFMRDAAPLHQDANQIIAGGQGSPFEFTMSID